MSTPCFSHAESATAPSGIRLTTIIPWCNRLELERTLRDNGPLLEAMRSQVVVVNCGGDAELLQRLVASSGVAARRIDVPVKFNRSLAINIGIGCAEPGALLILDADILLTSTLRPYAECCVERRCFGILAGMTSLPPQRPLFTPPPGSFLRKVVTSVRESYHWADNRVSDVVLGRTDCASDFRTACGIILVVSDEMKAIGGYRSDFHGWGWEDIDVQVRLLRHGVASMLVHEEIRHLEHGNDVRDLNGTKLHESAAANRRRAWRAYCAGDLHGTYLADVERWRPVISCRRVDAGAGA